MLRAVELLRRDRRPQEALSLAEQYIETFPSGPLLEEALVVRVEAADASGDPRAVSFGADYLERFPTGRFRQTILTLRQRTEIQ